MLGILSSVPPPVPNTQDPAPPSRSPGLFVTFEGVEGAGKTTQIALLRDALLARGFAVYTTREPGGNPVGEAIRGLLLSTENPVTDRAELLLFLAARAQLVEREIRPRLAAGEVVLCDRYVDSTTAYQGYGRGNDLDLVRALNDYATGGLQPDLTLLLDLEVEHGLRRQTDHNRMEAQSLAFHQRTREGFHALASAHPERIVVLDATAPIQEIHAQILKRVEASLPSRRVAADG